jgi:ribonuclease P protein component
VLVKRFVFRIRPKPVGLPRECRLRTAREFANVQTTGRSWAHPLLILRAVPNGLAHSRFGLVCGRRVGRAATRNLVKRRLRELARTSSLAPGWDVVLIARPGAATADFGALKNAFAELCRRGRLTQPPQADRP